MGVRARSSCSRSSDIFELLLETCFEAVECGAVACGGGVGGDLERFADLGEGEFGPGFEDEDFTLRFGEFCQGEFDLAAAFGLFERADEERSAGGRGVLFVAPARTGRAAEVDGGVANAREQVGDRVFRGAAGLPEFDEAFLHGVFGLLRCGEVLARHQEQRGLVRASQGCQFSEGESGTAAPE